MAIETTHEAELATYRLLDKLRGWLVQQEEWPVLMLSDRAIRRRTTEAIARELTTIPTRRYDPGVPNRKLRRAIIAELEKSGDDWWKGVSL
jgi:hypothetical protein